MNRQSYRDHLKSIHGDVSGDLREWGQASIFGIFQRPVEDADARLGGITEDPSNVDLVQISM